MRYIKSAVLYLLCNAAGLLLATLLLTGFRISWTAFFVAVLLMSVVLALIAPVARRIAEKRAPQLMGGISLVAIFLSLLVTSLLVSGMEIGGIGSWVAGTVIVWIGSLIASFLLPSLVFREKARPPTA
jgi:low temperature requirement protein LtrA